RVLGAYLAGLARPRTAVELGEDLLQAGTALAELLAVQEGGRHGHDLAPADLVLEKRPVDRDRAYPRVDDRHDVERLHHVRAVLAAERDVGLEVIVAGQCPDLLDHLRLELERMPARLQERKDERSEFVAEGDGGEADAGLGTRAADRERGLAA